MHAVDIGAAILLPQGNGDDMRICEAPLWQLVGILRVGGKSGNHGVSRNTLSICLASFFFSVFMCSFAGAATISIPDIGTFEAPDGFTALSPEEIKAYFTRGRPPTFALGDEKRRTTITYEIRAITIPPDKLPEVKSSLEAQMAELLPGLEFKKKEVVKMRGQPWLYFEHVVPGNDYDVYSILLLTPRSPKVLIMNFSCPKDDFPEMEPIFRRSIRSISLSAP